MDTKDTSPPSRGIILRAMRTKHMSKRALARALAVKVPSATVDNMHTNVKRWTRAKGTSSPDRFYAGLLAEILDVDAEKIVKQRGGPGDALRREVAELRQELARRDQAAGGS